MLQKIKEIDAQRDHLLVKVAGTVLGSALVMGVGLAIAAMIEPDYPEDDFEDFETEETE